MTNGANVSYFNVNFAADVLYMHVNSHFIGRIESKVFCGSRE